MPMTREQLEALLKMSGSDIGGLEEDQTALRSDADNARQMASTIRGNDWGANLGRAGYGIGGAVGKYKGMQATPGIAAAKKSTFADIIAGLSGNKSGAKVSGVPYDEDVSMY